MKLYNRKTTWTLCSLTIQQKDAYKVGMKTTVLHCHECGAEAIRKVDPKRPRKCFCSIKCKSDFQRRAKPITKEWLHEHYIEKGMDCVQIAHIVKRDPKSVWNWLKDFGIPARPRGTGWRRNLIHGAGNKNAFYGKNHSEETRKRLSEIAKADGRVPFDPKVGPPMRGKKGPQTVNWKGGITPQRQACYSSREWASAVKTIWKRDNATCQNCGLHKSNARHISFDIHHIKGFADVENRTNPDALVLLCEPCHYWAHSRKNIGKKFIE